MASGTRTQFAVVAIDGSGNAISGAEVQVNVTGGGAATVYAAKTGGTTVTNPVTTNSAGRATGWLDRGSYDLEISADGYETWTVEYDSVPGVDGGLDTAALANLAVTTAKLADAGVTTAKLADDAVTADKLAPGATTATYVTSLPGSPVDGQEVHYAADPTNGVIWHLRYRAGAAGSYKWEYLGGPPLVTANGTAVSTTGTSFVEGDTLVRVTAPLAGDYIVRGDGTAKTANVGTLLQIALGITSGAGGDTVIGEHRDYGGTDARDGYSASVRFTGRAASDIFCHKLKNGSGDGNSVTLSYRRLAVTPVRVG